VLGIFFLCYLSKEQMQGATKKLKPLRYTHFKITRQVSDNSFKLNLPPYMSMYSIKKVDNLHLFESSLLDGEEEVQSFSIIEDFVSNTL